MSCFLTLIIPSFNGTLEQALQNALSKGLTFMAKDCTCTATSFIQFHIEKNDHINIGIMEVVKEFARSQFTRNFLVGSLFILILWKSPIMAWSLFQVAQVLMSHKHFVIQNANSLAKRNLFHPLFQQLASLHLALLLYHVTNLIMFIVIWYEKEIEFE